MWRVRNANYLGPTSKSRPLVWKLCHAHCVGRLRLGLSATHSPLLNRCVSEVFVIALSVSERGDACACCPGLNRH